MIDLAPLVEPHVQPLQDAVEGAVGPPAAQPVVDRLPIAVAFGQLPPLGSGVQDPEDAVEGRQVVVPLPAGLAGGGHEILDQGELLGGQLVVAGHGGLRVPEDAMVTTCDSPDRT